MNTIIKQFLHQLSTFQQRLKQSQPPTTTGTEGKKTSTSSSSSKKKYKNRYLIGMKQIKSFLQSLELTSVSNSSSLLQNTPKCRLVCLAPNTELSEEIDEKLNEIISLARRLEIPLLYCLSKKQLGKALQMSLKQTIVAILDPNGVYDLFKKIISFVETRMK
jgi:ribosomal protein L7Ae-like RNA K-turn-binding protein